MGVANQDRRHDEALQRHLTVHDPVSNCPLLDGANVTLLPSGAHTLDVVFDAISAAERHIHMEYYQFEDVHWAGHRLVDLLVEKSRQGVGVAISYDGYGSGGTGKDVFRRLHEGGVRLRQFAPLSPLNRRFKLLHLNDRDHRKILLVDGTVAVVGGVNMNRAYENPRSAGAPPNVKKAYWFDAAVRLEGPPVAELQKLFLDTWRREAGDPLESDGFFPPLPKAGNHLVRTEGSAPRQDRQLYFDSLEAGLKAARSHVILSTGYFVPTHSHWHLLANTAKRGVSVNLILPGYSDMPSCVRAARALYGRLMRRGVHIHEIRTGMLHGKVATIDGVWTAIGTSNLDRRSYVYNNEVDAIILGRKTASEVEVMLKAWMREAEPITLNGWHHRSLNERAQELLTRVWSRYM